MKNIGLMFWKMIELKVGERVKEHSPAASHLPPRCPGRTPGMRAKKILQRIRRSNCPLVEEAVQNHLFTRIKNLRKANEAGHGLWRNLKGLVRRQAANTSLRPDQGSTLFLSIA